MRSFAARHWFLIVLALGLVAAFVVPEPLGYLTQYWEPNIAVGLSLFLIAWTMPGGSLVAEMRRPFASLWAVILSYGLVPVSASLLGTLAPEDVRVGLVLVACVPCTLSSAVLWTRLAGGDEATALLAVMGTTFTSWFLTTALLFWLTGAEVELDIGDMMVKLVATLILPVIVGQGLRRIPACSHFAQRHKTAFGVVSQFLILAIVLKAGVSAGEKLHAGGLSEAPVIFLWSVVLAVALHLFAVFAGIWSGRLLGFSAGQQIAIAFAASQKTLPVSLMLYDQYFKPQFPYAVLPLLSYHVGQLLLDTLIARRMARASTHHVGN
ncbi:MAG TPA: bile acid:sodium symporter [Gemmataceae bacterium]|nr:bile acid:sodium symporter [Gemmataceae bacterium]